MAETTFQPQTRVFSLTLYHSLLLLISPGFIPFPLPDLTKLNKTYGKRIVQSGYIQLHITVKLLTLILCIRKIPVSNPDS